MIERNQSRLKFQHSVHEGSSYIGLVRPQIRHVPDQSTEGFSANQSVITHDLTTIGPWGLSNRYKKWSLEAPNPRAICLSGASGGCGGEHVREHRFGVRQDLAEDAESEREGHPEGQVAGRGWAKGRCSTR